MASKRQKPGPEPPTYSPESADFALKILCEMVCASQQDRNLSVLWCLKIYPKVIDLLQDEENQGDNDKPPPPVRILLRKLVPENWTALNISRSSRAHPEFIDQPATFFVHAPHIVSDSITHETFQHLAEMGIRVEYSMLHPGNPVDALLKSLKEDLNALNASVGAKRLKTPTPASLSEAYRVKRSIGELRNVLDGIEDLYEL